MTKKNLIALVSVNILAFSLVACNKSVGIKGKEASKIQVTQESTLEQKLEESQANYRAAKKHANDRETYSQEEGYEDYDEVRDNYNEAKEVLADVRLKKIQLEGQNQRALESNEALVSSIDSPAHPLNKAFVIAKLNEAETRVKYAKMDTEIRKKRNLKVHIAEMKFQKVDYQIIVRDNKNALESVYNAGGESSIAGHLEDTIAKAEKEIAEIDKTLNLPENLIY